MCDLDMFKNIANIRIFHCQKRNPQPATFVGNLHAIFPFFNSCKRKS